VTSNFRTNDRLPPGGEGCPRFPGHPPFPPTEDDARHVVIEFVGAGQNWKAPPSDPNYLPASEYLIRSTEPRIPSGAPRVVGAKELCPVLRVPESTVETRVFLTANPNQGWPSSCQQSFGLVVYNRGATPHSLSSAPCPECRYAIQRPGVRQMASEPMPTAPARWWIEYENGDRSTDYDGEPEACAAIVELEAASGLRAEPAWLFSSDGQRFVIPIKGASR
jgi:hypothetical protein